MKKEYLTKIPDLGDVSKYAMTEIPKGLLGFSKIETNEIYDKEFWDEVVKTMKILDKRYEEECRKMKIDQVSGKSTMTWEERNREFTI